MYTEWTFRFYESRDFLDQLSDYQRFKEETVPWSLFSFIRNINRQLSHWDGWPWFSLLQALWDTSKDYCVMRCDTKQSGTCSLTFWRNMFPSASRFTRLHGVKSQIIILIITDMGTSNVNNTTTAVDNTPASYSGGPDFIFLFGDWKSLISSSVVLLCASK